MANKSLVNLWKRFYYYYFLSLFSYKKQLRCKMFDEFMYYISNNSPKVAPLPSPAPLPEGNLGPKLSVSAAIHSCYLCSNCYC